MKRIFTLLTLFLIVNGLLAQWVSQSQGQYAFNHISSVFFTSDNTGLAVGYRPFWAGSPPQALIIRTTDGGVQWNSINTTANDQLFSVCFPGPNIGYAVGGHIQDFTTPICCILKSADAGATWSTLKQEPGQMLFSVFFTNENMGVAAGDSGTILRTTDGGSNWQPRPSGTTQMLTSVCFPDATTGYIAGYGGVILKTSNGGADWFPLLSVFFRDTDLGYVAGEYGTLLKTTNGGGFPVGIPEVPVCSGRLNCYPNPVIFHLNVEVPVSGTLSLYDVNGLLLCRQEAIPPVTRLDATMLHVGVYMVKLEGEMGVQTGKFIKRLIASGVR